MHKFLNPVSVDLIKHYFSVSLHLHLSIPKILNIIKWRYVSDEIIMHFMYDMNAYFK